MSRICPVPIYGQWGVELGYGIVGGMVNDAARHGQRAARMAIEVLNGTPARKIPIMPAIYAPAFDYRQLKRFGIFLSALPENSRIINRPASLYFQYRKVIRATGGVIAGLLALIVILLVNIRRRKTSENALRTSEAKYRRLFEEDLTADFIAAPDGRLTDPKYRPLPRTS